MSREFRRFLARMKSAVRPSRVILFGSRARGDHRSSSDYDILVVSPSFRDVPWVLRAAPIYRLWDLSVDLEAICLTPDEFRRRKKEISIIGIAAREGLVI